MSDNPKSSARLAAIQSLYSLTIDQGQKPEMVLNSVFEELNRDNKNVKRKFAEELLNFSLKEKTEIESLVERFSDKKDNIKQMNPLLLSIVIVGLAELLKDNETDRPIILSEYMRIASQFFDKAETSFVNAVMDKFVKENS